MLLGAGLMVASCERTGSGTANAASPDGGAGGAPPPMPVAVVQASLQNVPVLLEAVGRAEGSKDVQVHARIGGLIERQHYREGERVRTGALLFTIERTPFEIALAQARATLAHEQARLTQAQREHKRLQPLATAHAISQREFDDAASARSLAEAAVAVAQAQVRQAQVNLSYTRVTAPIGGLTSRAEKSEGALVSPTNGLLTQLTQTDPIWVRFSFSETELARLRSGKVGHVRILSAQGEPVGDAGRLNFEGSTVDAQLGTVQLRAEFPNPTLAVLPGQFVRAQVHAGEEPAFVIPQAAVVNGDQGKAVWTVKDGKATPTPVEVGGWSGSNWVVRKGLQEGDSVIVDNLMKLRPGAPVQPRAAPVAGAVTDPAAPQSQSQAQAQSQAQSQAQPATR
jgi:membrane fusion protein (multidrug efflux system)